MAVPTGEYEVHVSLDLGVPFGAIEQTEIVSLVSPGEDILEQRLAQLTSEDWNVRRLALIDLRYFKSDAEKVVPALVASLDDEHATVRMVALSVLSAYPREAAEHCARFLKILEGGEGITQSERSQAAYLLARVSPADEEVHALLRKVAEETEEPYVVSFRSALRNYERRFPAKDE